MQIPLTAPKIELAPVFYQHGGFYDDQNGMDVNGTIGRNSRAICDNATDPAWRTRLQTHVERHEGISEAADSHVGIFKRQFLELQPQDDIEELVFKSSTSPIGVKARMVARLQEWAVGPARASHDSLDAIDGTTAALDSAAGCSIDYETQEQNGVIQP